MMRILPLLLIVITPLAAIAEPGHYTVDSEQSWVRVLVYRGGLMSRLGHNHTVDVAVAGSGEATNDNHSITGSLRMMVNEMVVDAPTSRDAEGDEFPGHLKPKDIDGTRDNMLGRKLLDASRFPDIVVTCQRIGELDGVRVAELLVTLKGVEWPLQVPVDVAEENGKLTVRGSFPLSHQQIGLKPFKAALGALRVRNEMQIKFEIVASVDR